MYLGFLLSEPKYVSCRRLGEVMNISHDSVNRFLNRESYDGEDLFNEVKPLINLSGGTLSVDDSVLDKPWLYMGSKVFCTRVDSNDESRALPRFLTL